MRHEGHLLVTVTSMRVHVVDHPLVSHKLTTLRDERTDSPTFRRLADELVTLLAYEATRDVRVDAVTVQTPVAAAQGVHLAFVELRSRLHHLVRDYGLLRTLDRDHFYASIDDAIADIAAERGGGAGRPAP